jgi:hypothetical protein
VLKFETQSVLSLQSARKTMASKKKDFKDKDNAQEFILDFDSDTPCLKTKMFLLLKETKIIKRKRGHRQATHRGLTPTTQSNPSCICKKQVDRRSQRVETKQGTQYTQRIYLNAHFHAFLLEIMQLLLERKDVHNTTDT